MKKGILLIIIATLLVANKAYSYGDSFRTWILESTAIVVSSNLIWNIDKTDLDRNSTLPKGKIDIAEIIWGQVSGGTTIDAYQLGCNLYDDDMENTSSIRFLRKEADAYYLLGSIQNITKTDIEFIRQRITELQDIYKIEDLKARYPKIIDWMVTCIQNSHTRNACYELDTYSDFLEYYKDKGVISSTTIQLDPAQKKIIKTHLFTYELSWEDLDIVDLIMKDYLAETEKFLLDMLKGLTDDKLYYADWIMERLLKIKTDGKLKKIAKAIESDKFEKLRQKGLVNDFIKAYEKNGGDKTQK